MTSWLASYETVWECLSGHCVDGVCCNSACNGVCQACTNAKTGGTTGTCGSITSGSDPDNECAYGACAAGSICKLDNGQTCAAATACLSGNCVDGYCCNTSCATTCKACNVAGSLGTCTNVSANQPDNYPVGACSGGFACNGTGVCKKVNGQSCGAPTDCLSGFCVDTYCCNTGCATDCQSCNVAGNPGTCTNVSANSDDGTCSGMTKSCDGNGVCKKENGQTCGAATDCLSGTCVDGYCCNDTCNTACKA